ncbi:lppC lipofamily protein, partial [Escherichia coli 5.2239]
RSDR